MFCLTSYHLAISII
uniref:Uncharacterized protein n=1 Tax=Arundo donax TaxID=35708 RepID=A0A0A9BJT6_ARUDO